MIPTPNNSRSWWSRSSILLKSSSSNKQQSSSQSNRLSASKKFNTIASVIGLKPKKLATPVEEPPSPVLPLHTGDIDAPPSPALKPVSVAVGWADPRDVEPPLSDDFVDGQSVFSTDIDPFAASGFPDGTLNVPESLRFSTLSDISTFESHVRRDASYAHNRTSFASTSSLSHQRSDVTSDFSPTSSPLLSPVNSGRHLSRLTVESGVLPREPYLASPVSPQSFRSCWDEGGYIVTSPSSVTLTDTNAVPPRPKTRPRGFTDVGPSTVSALDYSASDQKLPSGSPYNLAAPRVVVRQPSSTKLHPLRPPTAPPAIELPPAPETARRENFSLLPAFPERPTHSAASSSSSLSFASSTSSKFDTVVPEVQRRDVRRLKDSKKTSKSRPASPSSRNVQDLPCKVSTSRREFSPTRTLKKAISIQNLPKKPQGNSVPSPTVPTTAEDTKPIKKQRSFHHTRILMAPFPASLKQSNYSPGRDALSVPDERRDSAQSSPKVPITPPVSNQMRVRERLFSGSGRRHASPQSPGPDDETQSIFSLSSGSPHIRPHTAIPVNRSPVSPVSAKPESSSSFWDEEAPNSSPVTGSESQDYGPQQILSAADILKFENMVRDGENLSDFVRSRGNSVASVGACKHSGRTAFEPVSLSPPPVKRNLDPSRGTNCRLVIPDRPRSRGISLHGKVGHPPTIVPPSPAVSTRSLPFQSLNALPGLPVPPRVRIRPSTSSGFSTALPERTPSLGPGDRSSVILHPLSPPPMRRNAARRILDPPSPPSVPQKPAITRRPSFLDMRDEPDRDPPPPIEPPIEDSFLDMSKASLDTVRSSMEEEHAGLS